MYAAETIASGTVLIAAGIAAAWLWPRELELVPPQPPAPMVELHDGGVTVSRPGQVVVADVLALNDELYAYLRFGLLREFTGKGEHRVWLTFDRRGGAAPYVIRMATGNLAAAIPQLAELHAGGMIEAMEWRWVTAEEAQRYEGQTRTFDRVYRFPARHKLEAIPRRELARHVRTFIRFKSTTDGRVRRRLDAWPAAPSEAEAHRLARDIISVADFYALPLDLLLGIGAMENNYVDVDGDIGNAVWKRRAHKGDAVMGRGRRGILVRNESAGIWQITRETLRYAHRLYLKDDRDYSELPEHLRPRAELDIDALPRELLTTYAGLYLRSLIDRFEGDTAKAVGAYNGGPGNPNERYGQGAQVAADQARRILEHAATMDGRRVPAMRFLAAP